MSAMSAASGIWGIQNSNNMTKEEAIKRIKAWNLDSDDMEVLSAVIPELAESEEEDTRKELIRFLLYRACHSLNEETGRKFIAYLEKQKEQKPAEWSEEDDRIRRNLMSLLYNMRNNRITEGTFQKYYPWLTTLPERFNLQPKQEWSGEDKKFIKHCADVLDEQGEPIVRVTLRISPSQPEQEWSEEDEYKVDVICRLIERATIIPRCGDDDTGIPPTRLNDKYKGELKAFVESFRERPTKSDTWKPSEEQMGALYYAYCELFKRQDVGDNVIGPLQSLIDTLSKL